VLGVYAGAVAVVEVPVADAHRADGGGEVEVKVDAGEGVEPVAGGHIAQLVAKSLGGRPRRCPRVETAA
jgi:hypothetical protein